MDSGLVKGHAYGVTAMKEVVVAFSLQCLLDIPTALSPGCDCGGLPQGQEVDDGSD